MNKEQSQLLVMIKAIDSLFKQHNIRYTVLCGTVLGAIRHKGFIPWDDDINIGVFRKDFNKVEELLKANNEFSYEPVEEHIVPDSPIGRLRFPNVAIERNKWSTVDVFVIENVPASRKIQKKMFNAAKWYHLGILGKPAQNRGLLPKILTWCLLTFIPKPMWKSIKAKSLKQITKYNSDTECLGIILGVDIYKEVFPRKIYEEITYIQFEDTMLPAPSDFNTYLSQLYGDYMTPPPEEYRYTDHTSKRKY